MTATQELDLALSRLVLLEGMVLVPTISAVGGSTSALMKATVMA